MRSPSVPMAETPLARSAEAGSPPRPPGAPSAWLIAVATARWWGDVRWPRVVFWRTCSDLLGSVPAFVSPIFAPSAVASAYRLTALVEERSTRSMQGEEPRVRPGPARRPCVGAVMNGSLDKHNWMLRSPGWFRMEQNRTPLCSAARAGPTGHRRWFGEGGYYDLSLFLSLSLYRPTHKKRRSSSVQCFRDASETQASVSCGSHSPLITDIPANKQQGTPQHETASFENHWQFLKNKDVK
ncbi:hypothetical protein AALO_G00291270 [Alosa alosa]|uniref:Uncharacterized protein n=1 Tax=Alosa alosa TaxID=278164 RepID=A0AAV6FGU2_9TELE|nr:hypothetical protein AALO_G00291270 [Alosa alosa]